MPKKLQIWVYGAGAVGCFYGAKLLEANAEVSFIARGQQFEALQSRGLSVDSVNGNLNFPVLNVLTESELIHLSEPDVILICTKTYSNLQVIDNLKKFLKPKTVLFVLQNGISSVQPFAEQFNVFESPRVFRGIMNIACSLASPGLVIHKSGGLLILQDSHSIAEALRFLFASVNVECKLSQNIEFDIWNKALWNAPFNAVTAISRLTTTPILEDSDGLHLIKKLAAEVCQLAESEGVLLWKSGSESMNQAVEKKIEFTLNTLGDITTSTREDVLAGRELECNAIVGDLMNIGIKNNLPTPYLDAAYRFLKLLNKHQKN
jgi:2-dehydropantoate 2-reductase